MGVLHSKPRGRRRRTSKRQSPEGGACPDAAPSRPIDGRQCAETCPCNKLPYDETKESQCRGDNLKVLTSPNLLSTERPTSPTKTTQSEDLQANLRVRLPPRSSATCEKCKTSTSVQSPSPRPNVRTEGESEWTISFTGNDDTEGVKRLRDEELHRLMSSIRDAVDSEIGRCSTEQKLVRVTLSVTPEAASQNRIRNESDQASSIPQVPTSRRDDGVSTRRNHMSGEMRCCNAHSSRSKSSEKASLERDVIDRQGHYRQIPGSENDKVVGSSALKEADAARSPATRCKRDQEGKRSRSRDRHHTSRHGNRCHRANKSRSNRYQSPFDQQFQEAMYIRLSALQRDSAREAELAKGKRPDDVMNGASSSSSSSELDSEYSGDEDGAVLSEKVAAAGKVARIFQPLGSKTMEEMSKPSEKLVEHQAERSVSVQRQQVHGNSDCRKVSTLPAPLTNHMHRLEERVGVDGTRLCCSVSHSRTLSPSPAARNRSWRSAGESSANSRKKLTKTRKKSAANLPSSRKSSHGYLRANSLTPGATCAIPSSLKTTQIESRVANDSNSAVVVEQHQHIHHHYYYNYKPDS